MMEELLKLRQNMSRKDAQIRTLTEKVKSLQAQLDEMNEVDDPYNDNTNKSTVTSVSSKRKLDKEAEEEEKINAMIQKAFEQNHQEAVQERVKAKEEAVSAQQQRIQQQQHQMAVFRQMQKRIQQLKHKAIKMEETAFMAHDPLYTPALRDLAYFQHQVEFLRNKLLSRGIDESDLSTGAPGASPTASAGPLPPADKLGIPFLESFDPSTPDDAAILRTEEGSAFCSQMRSLKQELVVRLGLLRSQIGQGYKDLYGILTNRLYSGTQQRLQCIKMLRESLSNIAKTEVDVIRCYQNYVRKMGVEERGLKSKLRETAKRPCADVYVECVLPTATEVECKITIEVLNENLTKLKTEVTALKTEVETTRTQMSASQIRGGVAQACATRIHEMLVNVLKLVQKETHFCEENDLKWEVETNSSSGDGGKLANPLDNLISRDSALVAKLTSFYCRPKDGIAELQDRIARNKWKAKSMIRVAQAAANMSMIHSKFKPTKTGETPPASPRRRSSAMPHSPTRVNDRRKSNVVVVHHDEEEESDGSHHVQSESRSHSPEDVLLEISDIIPSDEPQPKGAQVMVMDAAESTDSDIPTYKEQPKKQQRKKKQSTTSSRASSPGSRRSTVQSLHSSLRKEKRNVSPPLSEEPLLASSCAPRETTPPPAVSRTPAKHEETLKLNQNVSMRIIRLGNNASGNPQHSSLSTTSILNKTLPTSFTGVNTSRPKQRPLSAGAVRANTLGAPHPETVAEFEKGLGDVIAQGSAMNLLKGTKIATPHHVEVKGGGKGTK
eukprot:PhF_6_TR42636/c0_g1_i2/m.64127